MGYESPAVPKAASAGLFFGPLIGSGQRRFGLFSHVISPPATIA